MDLLQRKEKAALRDFLGLIKMTEEDEQIWKKWNGTPRQRVNSQELMVILSGDFRIEFKKMALTTILVGSYLDLWLRLNQSKGDTCFYGGLLFSEIPTNDVMAAISSQPEMLFFAVELVDKLWAISKNVEPKLKKHYNGLTWHYTIHLLGTLTPKFGHGVERIYDIFASECMERPACEDGLGYLSLQPRSSAPDLGHLVS